MMKVLLQLLATYLIVQPIACDECDTMPDIKTGFKTSSCCQIPLLFEESWIDACKIHFESPNKPGARLLEDEWKMYECIVKQGGGIVDGKPSTTVIKKQMKTIMDKIPEWETVFNAAVDKCVPEVIAKEDETRRRASEPPYNVDKNVTTIYGHLFACIGLDLYLECPVPVDADNPNCKILKNFLKKCANEFPLRFMKPTAN